VLATVLFLASSHVAFAGALPAQDGKQLHFIERDQIPVPDSLVLSGVTLGDEGTIIGWDESAQVIAQISAERGFQIKCAELPMKVLAASMAEGRLTVVSPQGTIATLSTENSGRSCTAEPVARLSLGPDIASYSEGKWYAGWTDSTGASRLVSVTLEGEREEIQLRQTADVDLAMSRPSVSHDGLVIGSARPPFRWIDLSVLGDRPIPVREFAWDPSVCAPRSGDSAEESSWISVGTVRLGANYLQSLADEKSDERCFVLYGSDGRFVRSTDVKVPMAIVGTRMSDQGLEAVAVRHLNRQVVVLYELRSRS
jgi:hypothetical protein